MFLFVAMFPWKQFHTVPSSPTCTFLLSQIFPEAENAFPRKEEKKPKISETSFALKYHSSLFFMFGFYVVIFTMYV